MQKCNEAKAAIAAREALQPALDDAKRAVTALETEYTNANAKAKVGNGPVETSADRADLRFLVKYAHMD